MVQTYDYYTQASFYMLVADIDSHESAGFFP
jgi:hypothetical protein